MRLLLGLVSAIGFLVAGCDAQVSPMEEASPNSPVGATIDEAKDALTKVLPNKRFESLESDSRAGANAPLSPACRTYQQYVSSLTVASSQVAAQLQGEETIGPYSIKLSERTANLPGYRQYAAVFTAFEGWVNSVNIDAKARDHSDFKILSQIKKSGLTRDQRGTLYRDITGCLETLGWVRSQSAPFSLREDDLGSLYSKAEDRDPLRILVLAKESAIDPQSGYELTVSYTSRSPDKR